MKKKTENPKKKVEKKPPIKKVVKKVTAKKVVAKKIVAKKVVAKKPAPKKVAVAKVIQKKEPEKKPDTIDSGIQDQLDEVNRIDQPLTDDQITEERREIALDIPDHLNKKPLEPEEVFKEKEPEEELEIEVGEEIMEGVMDQPDVVEKKEKSPLINVLIRTSRDLAGFLKAYSSVLKQDYDNVRIIVSADTTYAMNYLVPFLGVITRIDVRRFHKKSGGPKHKPYNIYLNHLFYAVKKGWIFILDDDDHICKPDFFTKISTHMNRPDNFIFWKMRMSDGREIPEPEYLCKEPVVKHIGMPCFAFHSDYKDKHVFDEGRRADFKLVTTLYPLINNKHCFDEVFIQLGNTGRHGQF